MRLPALPFRSTSRFASATGLPWAGFEGTVAEVTWRATKIRTKAGNLVIVPNNIVAREPINNYSRA